MQELFSEIFSGCGRLDIMINDSNLEHGAWVAKTGPGIGPVPQTFLILPPLDDESPLILYVANPTYGNGLAASYRPLMPAFDPTAIPLAFEYEVCTDGNGPSLAQAIETDLLYCGADGYKAIGGLQNNYQLGGVIQISNAAGDWVNTDVTLGKFAPGVWYSVKINYLVNAVAHTITYVSLVVNGITYPLGQTFASTLMSPIWKPGVYAQLQTDVGAAGGGFSVGFKNVGLVWG
jgi:hypothetical protein